MFQSPRYHHSPLPKRITKSVLWRAVDVNRPVTLWCVPVAVLATRARNVTGGLTSPARLVTVGRIQGMKSGVLHTVSPSQGEAPAEPHPCRERCTEPCCSIKTPAIAHSRDQRSVARQEPRTPESSPVCSQHSRELQRHWAQAPTCVSHRKCALCQTRLRRVGNAPAGCRNATCFGSPAELGSINKGSRSQIARHWNLLFGGGASACTHEDTAAGAVQLTVHRLRFRN
jgi:hypothetical protein